MSDIDAPMLGADKSQQWVLDWQEEPILLRDTEASVLGFAR
jgi:hypothetical protein